MDVPRECLYIGTKDRTTVPFTGRTPAPRRNTPINTQEIYHGFPAEFETAFKTLLQDFSSVFQPGIPLTQTKSIQHCIKLTNNVPFRLPPCRYSEDKKKIIREQVQEMLHDQVIEPCCSPYSSPIVIAKTKDGKNRFCINFRKLNQITEDTAQPIPVIHEELKELGTARIFTSPDF